MNTNEIPEGARSLSMEYTYYHTIEIDEEIDLKEVKQWWVKYGILFIEMNDGKIYEQTTQDNWENINWKRGHRNMEWLTEDYSKIDLGAVHE